MTIEKVDLTYCYAIYLHKMQWTLILVYTNFTLWELSIFSHVVMLSLEYPQSKSYNAGGLTFC